MKKGDKTLCDCGHEAVSDGFSTGYGVDNEGKKICFRCCGERDKKFLRDNGRLSGYFTGNGDHMEFTNWPGTLKLKVVSHRYSHHNFAGRNGRCDFWVYFEGNRYHGVHIGANNECATIRIVKS
jgi:hypothetical protein